MGVGHLVVLEVLIQVVGLAGGGFEDREGGEMFLHLLGVGDSSGGAAVALFFRVVNGLRLGDLRGLIEVDRHDLDLFVTN